MASAFSNTLTNALSNKINPSPLAYSPSFAKQSSTPVAAVRIPNTQTNIAYGGPTTVPTGTYTNTPNSNLPKTSGYPLTAPSNPIPLLSSNNNQKNTPDVTSNTVQNGSTTTAEPPKYDAKGNLTDYGMAALHNSISASTPNNNQNTNSSNQNNTTQSTQLSPNQGLYGGLISRAMGFQDQAKDLQGKEIALMNNLNQTKTDIMHDPNYSLDTAIGRAGQVEQSYGNQLLGLTQGANYANTNAATAANIAGLAAPVNQFGQLTNPITGAVIGAGATGNNPMLEGAVQNAIKLINNGASQSDAIATSGLSNFGAAGTTALSNALLGTNSGYNPTAQNTQATTNVTLGSQYQQQATDLDTSLKQLDTVSSLASNFLNNNNLLNPTSNPNYNKAINTYVANFSNPSDAATYNAILGDIKKFTSQILSSNNGTIPTDQTEMLKTFDPSNLSAPQLLPYLQNLKQLGQNQLSVLQTQSTSAYGGSNGYSGTPATSSSNTVSAPNANLNITPSQLGQFGVGGALNIAGGIEGMLSKIPGLAATIFGAL